MNHLYENLEVRMKELKKIIKQKERALKKAPQGILNVHSSKERVQYYYKENSADKVRKYLKGNEKQLVKELCQKDYDERVLEAAQKELKILEKLYKLYQGQVCEEVFEGLNVHRQEFITSIRIPDNEFVENWEHVTYEQMGFSEDYPEYFTDRGERVRSKSEVLIGNALNKHSIPYRYEYPLYLEDNVTTHPDFTVLNVKRRKEKYWEHFGRMDDPTYVEKVLKKIETYEKNGIFIGENLIVTFENKKKPLNIKTVNLMIARYLM